MHPLTIAAALCLTAAGIWATDWRFALLGAAAALASLPQPARDEILEAATGLARATAQALLLTALAAMLLLAGGALLWPILHAGQTYGDMIPMGLLILGIALSVNWR
jgi:hypothetical protein